MNKNSAAGVTFLDLLTIVFIILKLTKVISWSWWWVLSPIWIPFSILLIVACFLIIKAAIEDYKDRKKE